MQFNQDFSGNPTIDSGLMGHSVPVLDNVVTTRESLIRPEQVNQRIEKLIPSNFSPTMLPSAAPMTPMLPSPNIDVSVRKPEDEYFVEPKDLFNPNIPIDKWFYKALPKGSDLQKLLTNLKSRYISNTHLPVNKQVLAQDQLEDPEFKFIYAYIKSGVLPNRKDKQRKILSQAEHYAMADEILFKIDKATDHATGETYLRTRVCIPDKFLPYLLHIYHESLLSCHIGIEKTYDNLRDKFYIKHLTQRVGDWIRSCQVCQTIKRDQSEPRIVEGRFSVNQNPFEEISLDIKHMINGVNGHNFLLVGCCNMTRYVIATPLRRADAIHIAEAIVDIALTWGIPKVIYMDLDKGFTNQLTNFIYNALGIKRTIISPFVHQSFLVERHIGTISRFITSNLTGNGKQWPLYVKSSLFAYNTSPIIGVKVSPYELVFGRKAPVLDNLKFSPLGDIKTSYRDYATWIKNRIQAISIYMEKLRTTHQLDAIANDALRVQKLAKYIKGSLVYLMAPTLSTLVTASRKIKASFIGPLAVAEIVSAEKVILEDLYGRKLHGVHGFDRLKQGYVRIQNGKASTIEELKKAINLSEFNKIGSNTDILNTEGLHSMFAILPSNQLNNHTNKVESNEGEALIPYLSKSELSIHIYYPCSYFKEGIQGEPQNMNKYIPHIQANNGLAFKVKLPSYKLKRVIKQDKKMPQLDAELNVTKAKYSNGILNVLLTTVNDDSKARYSFWYPIENDSAVNKKLRSLCSKKNIKCSGSLQRFEDRIRNVNWKPIRSSGMNSESGPIIG